MGETDNGNVSSPDRVSTRLLRPRRHHRHRPDDDRLIDYRLLWAYYQNSVFDDLAAYAGYRSRYRLYRHIRPIYNPPNG